MSGKVAAGDAIRAALLAADPRAKVMAARSVARAWRSGRLAPVFDAAMPDRPGRPEHPRLLPPGRMPKRGRGGSERARIALWHALAHIEFVAIDLALDMAGRFGREMGEGFVSDFLSVAADEAMHFAVLERKLRRLGSHYGALPAHDGLWEAAEKTRHDVAARLAIVPMVLEARALDITPATVTRFEDVGDMASGRILRRIVTDEIRHVAAGTNWFNWATNRRGLTAPAHYQMLVKRHFRGSLKPPFNDSARRQAGLTEEFYAALAS